MEQFKAFRLDVFYLGFDLSLGQHRSFVRGLLEQKTAIFVAVQFFAYLLTRPQMTIPSFNGVIGRISMEMPAFVSFTKYSHLS